MLSGKLLIYIQLKLIDGLATVHSTGLDTWPVILVEPVLYTCFLAATALDDANVLETSSSEVK